MPVVDKRFVLTKGPPWGFRIYLDSKELLTISKIRRHSPAESAKLRSGDQIISINGKLTTGLSHSEAIMLIDSTFGTLYIEVSRFESISTQVLTFEKVDTKIPDDVKTNIDLNLIRKEESPEETNVFDSTLEPEKYSNVVYEESAPIDEIVRPSSPGVRPMPISKLIKEYNIPDDFEDSVPKKKQFADSSFYNDPYNLYPSTEEKMEMARRVASSLYAPDNKSSKGANIFAKQRQRADKYTLQKEESTVNSFVTDEPKFDLAHWPEVAGPKERSPSPMYRLGYSSGPAKPPPPPPAPPIPNEAKSIQEFMEKVKRFPKTQHNVISPNACFDIASALHTSDSRGAQIFAKQKHRAQKWTLTSPEKTAAQPVFAASPGPSSDFNRPYGLDQKPKANVVSISRNNISQFSNNDNKHVEESSEVPTRKPAHVIRRDSNRGSVEPLKTVNRLTMSTSSNVAISSPPTDISQATTNTKWKPVKFNIPQRA